MTVLVTGASGWVGQSLCQRLRLDGVDFRSVGRTSVAAHSEFFLIASMDESTQWQAALKGVQAVVHLAARVHVMRDSSGSPLEDYRRVNVRGSLNLAQQAAAAGVKRFVFLSSIKVNGECTRPGHPFTEQDSPEPQDPYAISKFEAEAGLRQIASSTGMEVVIVRPPLVYGSGVKANFAALARAVQRGWPLPLGAIHNRRSLIALDNLVDFIVACLAHPLAANQTFLISDGHDLSTTELVLGLSKAAGVPARIWPVPVALLEFVGRLLGQLTAIQRLTRNLQIDSTKAFKLLDWSPKIQIDVGLKCVFGSRSTW